MQSADEPEESGAQGETISDGDPGRLLGDERYVKSDTALIRRAIAAGWAVPKAIRDATVARMDGIVRKTAVLVPTAQGVVENEAIADANAIAAARVLTTMTGQDQQGIQHEDNLAVKKANAVVGAMNAGMVPKNYHGLDPGKV